MKDHLGNIGINGEINSEIDDIKSKGLGLNPLDSG
jgi:hypothetical protein